MKPFKEHFTNIDFHLSNMRNPDFIYLIKIFNRQKPDRPTFYEFILNNDLIMKLADKAFL